jgi:hypothetical protein
VYKKEPRTRELVRFPIFDNFSFLVSDLVRTGSDSLTSSTLRINLCHLHPRISAITRMQDLKLFVAVAILSSVGVIVAAPVP